jgi:DNA-binding NarL/FixJ family response regulator
MPKRADNTVLLVEEEPFLRSVLATLIGAQQGFRVVLATDPGSLPDAAQKIVPPRITVVGLGNEPVDTQRATGVLGWLRKQWPDTCILILTCACGRELLTHTVNMGVRGYIQRSTQTITDLLQALDDLLSKGHAIPTELVLEIARLNEPSADDLLEAQLTRMQKKVLEGVCAFDDPIWAVVAERLFKDVKTVGTHCAALYATLNVHDKEEVKAWGRRRGYGLGKW